MHHSLLHSLLSTDSPKPATGSLFQRLSALTWLCFFLITNVTATLAYANTEYPSAGVLTLEHASGDIEAVQLDAHLELTVTGLLAEATLTQTFKNTTEFWVNGRYLFPLHEESAVQGMMMLVGKRQIQGIVMPRADAQQTFTQAQEAGQIAALVQQQRPNLFTLNAASIAPGENIVVKLSLTLPIEVSHQHMHLRLPTTLTPRYTNPLTTDATNIEARFAGLSNIRGPRISIDGQFDPLSTLGNLESPTHELDNTDTGFHIASTPMNKDVLLQWPMNVDEHTTATAVVTPHNGERYVQILMNPPNIRSTPAINRELVLVIDKSGSMAGVSMRSAKEALLIAIDGLQPEDTFNLIAFDHDYYPLFPSARLATTENKYRAREYVGALVAEGGTEMQDVLSFALNKTKRNIKPLEVQTGKSKIKRLKQVVFLTDGSVGYEDALLKHIEKNIGDNRLFTVGIGPAPNRWFIEKAATVGRGVSLTIRHSSDVIGPITELLTELESPVLTDIKVQYTGGFGEIYPNPLPDLYANRPGVWVSKISHNVSDIVVTGNRNGERFSQTLKLPHTQQSHSQKAEQAPTPHAPAVVMHWARQKIDSLLDEQRYSFDSKLHKEQITKIGMETGLVTPYTSLVAVDHTVTVPPVKARRDVDVAQLIPEGNDMYSVLLPQGASGADTWTLLSFLCAATGILLMVFSRSPWLSNRDQLRA